MTELKMPDLPDTSLKGKLGLHMGMSKDWSKMHTSMFGDAKVKTPKLGRGMRRGKRKLSLGR